MKKKGLLISTIVMVVVLIASLTTATYAWFSSSASASVDPIALNAIAADGLLIGALGTDTAAGSRAYTDYRNGTVEWDGTNGYWSGDTYMGTNLNFQTLQGEPAAAANMVIDSTKAVSYTTTALAGTGSASGVSIAANNWYKANGDGATKDLGTLAEAAPQYDYVDLDLAVTASSAGKVKQAWMTVQVVPTNAQLKMAAAIHFYIEIGGTSYTGTIATHGISAYSGKVQSNNFTDACDKGTYVSSNGTTIDTKHSTTAGDWYFVLPLWNSDTTMVPYEDIVEIKFMAWIEGTDDACVVANAGTGGTVNIFFDYGENYNVANNSWTFNTSTGVMTKYTGA